MDIIELATPVIVKRYLSTLSVSQRVGLNTLNKCLQSLAKLRTML